MLNRRLVFVSSMLLVVIWTGGVYSVAGQTQSRNEIRRTNGIFFFPSLAVTMWSADEFDISRESGTGGGIGFGYGISNRFALLVNFIGGSMHQKRTNDFYTLSHFDVGARATLGRLQSPLKYVVDVMLSGISSNNIFPKPEVKLAGRMYSLGAGVQYFLSKTIALQMHASTGQGSFNEYKLDGEKVELETIDRSFQTTRFSLSVVWFASQ